MPDTLLDVKGLKCPLPVLKVQKKMKTINPGDVLSVEATDPLSVIDIPAYCNESGNILVQQSNENEVHIFRIQKAESQVSHRRK